MPGVPNSCTLTELDSSASRADTGFVSRASPIFLRFLSFYLLLIILPLVVFSLFLFRHVSDLLVENAITEANTRLGILEAAVDRELQIASDTSHKIASSQRLRPFLISESPGTAYFAVRALGEFRLPSSAIDEIFLHFHRDEYLICSSTTVGLDRLEVVTGGADDPDAERFVADILAEDPEEPVSGPYRVSLFTPNPVEEYYLLRFAIPSWSPTRYATLAFAVSASRLLALAPAGATPLEYAIAPPGATVPDAGDGFIATSRLSPRTGWLFHAVAEAEVITAPARQLQRLSVLVIVTTGAAAALVVIAGFIVNYRPVKRLLEVLAGAHLPAEPIASFDEAQQTLSSLISHERVLEARVHEREANAREGAVTRLLAGVAAARLDLEGLWTGTTTGDQLGSGTLFAALAIRPPGRDAHYDALEGVLHGVMSEEPAGRDFRDVGWLCRAGTGREPAVLVIRIQAAGPLRAQARLAELAEVILQRLRDQWEDGAVVGVGAAVTTIGEIGRSYDLARTAVEQSFVLGVGRVIVSWELGESRWDRMPVVVDQHALRRAVVSGQPDEIAHYFETIGELLREDRVPAYIARGLCVEICRLAGELAVEIGRETGIAVERPECSAHVERAVSYEAFSRDVTRLLTRVAALHQGRRDRESARLYEEMRARIDEQTGDPQFSIQALAEHVGLAPSVVTSLFRRYHGTGPNAYLVARRVEEAQRLLRETDLPLKEVAAQVGYHNVSSFIRRYRTLTGETPGDYRREGAPS
jgi:two-component system, response regulator YesN